MARAGAHGARGRRPAPPGYARHCRAVALPVRKPRLKPRPGFNPCRQWIRGGGGSQPAAFGWHPQMSQIRGNPMPKHLLVEREPSDVRRPAVSRRWLIAATGALATYLGLGGPTGAQPGTAKKSPAAATSPQQAIVAATKRCETVGNICLRHCQRLTRLGDKTLADCMRSVSAMIPICVATNKLASQDAKQLQALAKVCAEVCRECEAECRKHEFHHVECKRCAEACAETVKVLAAL